jgi:methenyltetrahydrofolate cyclohydrolase
MAEEVLAAVLDSTNATVGGGSASALAGAMAAGLAGMVARLSTRRGLELGDEEYLAVAEESDALGRALRSGAREDADAYGAIGAAYGRSRESDEAIAAREAAIEEALEAAALVPLENARRSLRVRELCARLDGRSNAAAGSDLAAAVLLSDAAVRGCLLNVDVNVVMLPDSPAVASLRRDAAAVRTSHERVHAPAKEPR